MGELQLDGAQPQNAEAQKHEPHAETDPALKARTRLAELLRPSESVAGEIQKRVFAVGEKIIGEHPHPEMRRIVDTAIGVYLWEHMASPQEGQSLPLGLTTRIEGDEIQTPMFDNRFLSRDEYAYVFAAMEQEGVVDDVFQLKHKDWVEKKEHIIDALDGVLKHSPAAAFLETFAVTPRKEPMQTRALRDLNDTEAGALHAKLDAEFRTKYARVINGQSLDAAMATQPGLRMSYMMEVTKPVNMATTPGSREDHRPAKETTDVATRERFQEYVDTEFFQKHFPLRPGETLAECISIRNGHFYFSYPTHDTGIHVDDRWLDVILPSLNKLNTSLYATPIGYSRVAMETISPLLYDRTDKRDTRTIMDEGYRTAAEKLYDELRSEPYHGLSLGMAHAEAARLDTLMWLQGTDLPLYEDGDPFVEPLGAKDQYIPEGKATEKTAYEVDYARRYSVGTITYRNPDVHLAQPHMITRVIRNKDIPMVPASRSDLVVSSSHSSFTRRTYTDSGLDEMDPYIEGYTLIARDDTMTYFVKNPDDGRYEPVTNEIPYIKQRAVADFCREIGMQGLADELDGYDRLSVAQLTDVLRKHVAYSFPEQSQESRETSIEYELATLDDWKTHVNQDGILHGQSELFAQFAVQVFSRIYQVKRPHTTAPRLARITTFGESMLENEGMNINGITHYQTHLRVPAENINAFIDISPSPTALQAALDSDPKTPPPPYKYEPPPYPQRYREPYVAPEREYTGDYVSVEDDVEYRRKLLERAGNIVFVEPIVFETRSGQWLFSKRPYDVLIPTPANLDPAVDEKIVLEIENIGDYLADDYHDPHIAGMKLVARDGDKYNFIIDEESTDYKPVELRIQNQVRNDLAITFMEIGMAGLSWEVKQAEDLTVEGLREMVQAYAKYLIPKEGKRYEIERLRDFQREGLINKEGILEGQCDTFDTFMRYVLQKMYGEKAVTLEVGHTLRNVMGISRMKHGQNRLVLPEHGINALIDVEPLDFEGTGIYEGAQAVNMRQKRGKRRPIIKAEFSDADRRRFLDDLRSGRALPDFSDLYEDDSTAEEWPEPPPRNEEHEAEFNAALAEAPEETRSAFAEALLKSLLKGLTRPRRHEQEQAEEPEEAEPPRVSGWRHAFSSLGLWRTENDEQQTHVLGEDAAWGTQAVTIPPEGETVEMSTDSVDMDAPTVRLEVPVQEAPAEPEPPEEEAKPYEDPPTIEFRIPVPPAPREPIEPPRQAEMLEEVVVEVPLPQAPREADLIRVEQTRVARRVHAATDAFLMNLSAYLGPRAGRYDDPNFVERVMQTEGAAAAERGPERARRILHLQLLNLIDRFRHLERGEFEENEYTDLSRSIARLGGIMGMYTDRGPGFRRLIQQRTYVDYSDHMLGVMRETIAAFAEWDKGRERTIRFQPTQLPDTSEINSAGFQRYPDADKDKPHFTPPPLPPTASEQHPEHELLTNDAYNSQFAGTGGLVRPEGQEEFQEAPSQLPSESHPDFAYLTSTAYTNQFVGTGGLVRPEGYEAPTAPHPLPSQHQHDEADQAFFSDRVQGAHEQRPSIPNPPLPQPTPNEEEAAYFSTRVDPPESTAVEEEPVELPPPQSEQEAENRRILADDDNNAAFADKTQPGLK